MPLFDAEHGVRGQHVDMILLDRLAVYHHMHRHRGIAPDNLGQQAVACGTEMRNDHEGQLRLFRHTAEKPFKRFDTARGGADANYRKSRWRAHRAIRATAYWRGDTVSETLAACWLGMGFLAAGRIESSR
jgi:hypothetical protein